MSSRIFITGGASGLGLALAQRCGRANWRVAVGDIHEERGRAAEAELRSAGVEAVYLYCDVTSETDLDQCAEELNERWGGVDVVVNNAGVAQAGPMETISIDDWRWILDINLLGVVRGCRAFVPQLKKQGHGHIVNVSSMAGLLDPPDMSAYSVTKAGVVKLSESLAVGVGPKRNSSKCPVPVLRPDSFGRVATGRPSAL